MSSQRLSQHTDEIDGQGCPAQLLLSSDDSKAKKRYLTVDDSTLSSHLKKKHKKHSTYEKDCEIEIDDDNSAEDNKFINLQASLKPFEKEYICNVFTLHSASSYLQYLESKSFKRFSSYLDYSKELVLTGPKGVGKSFTLLAVMATRSRENKPTVLLSVDSLTYIEHTVTYLHMILKEYCGDSKATHSTIESCLNQLVKMPCKSEIMLLVDICSIYSNTARSIENLLRLILSFRLNDSIKMVFAMTSDLGVSLPSEYRYLHVYFSLIFTMQKCRFTLFSKSEAKLYIEHYKHNCIMDMKVIKKLTNFNPYYLSRIDPNENQHKNQGRIRAKVAAYFNELVRAFSLHDLCSFMLPELEASQRWFYVASNGILLETDEFNEFLQSWVHAQHICEYKKKQGKYKLEYALPFSEKLLVSELSKLQSRLQLPKNPVIDGYLFEEKLFQFMNNAKRLDVVTNTGESLSLSLSYICRKNETVMTLHKSALYQLRYKHPIIDGIGILQDERNVWWLTFIQISLSPYTSHHTKVTDLFKYHVCRETPSTSKISTLFEYYVEMCDSPVMPIYIYISPKEIIGNGKLLWETAGKNILIGAIPKGSSTARGLKRCV